MLITIIVILLLISAAVVGSIYSNFTVFYSNFSESNNYHKAYYAAIAGLERGELVTKQREPGFQGEGGWKKGENVNGPQSDKKMNSNAFSYLSEGDTTIYWNVDSRTTRIPKLEEGDVEDGLKYFVNDGDPDNSENFNMMDYEDAQIFLLYYDDDDPSNAYTKTNCKSNPSNCVKSNITEIKGKIRLPKKLKDDLGFLYLDTTQPLVGGSDILPNNDVVVDRQIRGNYNNNPFTIYSNQVNDSETAPMDTAIRESDINDTNNEDFLLKFNMHNRSPFYRGSSSSPYKGGLSTPIRVGKDADAIKNLSRRYEDIFINRRSNQFSQLQLRFSLLNLLKPDDNHIYPFLEYYVDFDTDVADKYYTVKSEGYYGGYKVNKKVWKPTAKESVLSSFTSIFR